LFHQGRKEVRGGAVKTDFIGSGNQSDEIACEVDYFSWN